MRVILSNDDAELLAQLIADDPDAPSFRIETRERVGEGGTVWVLHSGAEFKGKARRTPGRAGTIYIEDPDGRIIAESKMSGQGF
jgi:hypothetical protein